MRSSLIFALALGAASAASGQITLQPTTIRQGTCPVTKTITSVIIQTDTVVKTTTDFQTTTDIKTTTDTITKTETGLKTVTAFITKTETAYKTLTETTTQKVTELVTKTSTETATKTITTTSVTTLPFEADGSLTPAEASIQAVTDGGEVHSTRYGGVDGKSFIAMAHYGTARIVTRALPLTPTSQPLQQVTFTIPAPGPNPRQDAPHPHAVFTDPTGAFLLTADLGSDRIHVFAIDAETGLLTQCPAGEAIPGDGPRHGVFWSPSNDTEASVLLTINELSNSVTSWEVTYEGGCLGLQQIESLSTLPDGVVPRMGAKAAEIRVRDNFVYASNRNDGSFGEKEDSIALYEIGLNGEGRAELQFVEISSAHSWFPRTFDINAAGDLVAVGGQTSAEVVVLERNITTGRLGAAVAAVRVGALGTANNEDGVSAVIWDE
ncbi:hypothetical protein BN1723_004899 [Verticillium longisporum]|uniref:6-phosphogluconolactonase n=1 Tax=Verticillium longisporum TaxID=100787 RepID=A0A0G4N2U2_VERLO|nr:hypothetical protein BN1708_000878 [Verticillium longisporum]CRK40655.1 hypothetical protein BN1723_004899 [Verticillium longisporum]